eukprot:GEMP01061255.1.p3 GENE.GEMP01061255.1~~GEMP01061255.1.p3  ORF type:complete len:181 (+),score=35.17 GEMP01061255.1:646-1188(+)
MPHGYVKLADFGFAKVLQPGTQTYTVCGTPQYMAPEVILTKGHRFAVDWWALGVLIYEMLFGQGPFADADAMSTFKRVLAGKIFFPETTVFHEHAKHLVKKLLSQKVSERIGNQRNGATDVLTHKWFTLSVQEVANQSLYPPYKPDMSGVDDLSHYPSYPEGIEKAAPTVLALRDPFINW